MRVRIEADGQTTATTSLVLVGVMAVASFSLSFVGLVTAASWAGIPEGLRWMVPVVVDSTILVYAVAATVQRARGESTLLSWCAAGFFTLVSVAANAAHVLAPEGDLLPFSLSVAFGAFLAAVMPVSLFFATHTAVQLGVAPVHGSVEQRRRRAAQKLAPASPVTKAATPRPATIRKVDPQEVLSLLAAGKSQREVAARMQTSKTAIARIAKTGNMPDRDPLPAL